MTCPDCQTIERCHQGPGELLLAPFLSHTLNSVRRGLEARGLTTREASPGVLSVHLPDGGPAAVDGPLRELMSEAEIRDCRASFLPQGHTFGIASLRDTHSLETLLARAGSGWLADLIEADRFEFHFQPIVSCADPGRPFAYESLMRGVIPGQEARVPPGRLIAQARASQLLFQLDRAARINAIRQAVAHGFEARVFINFNPTTIYDPAFCLKSTLEEVDRLGADADRLVFEVVESEHVSDTQHLQRIVDHYKQAGFQVALDDLGAGYSSLNLLSSLRPDFVKFDRELVSHVHEDTYKQTVLSKLIEMAQELEICTIAEGVEQVGEWEWLRARAVDYVQGYLFARPASPPPDPVSPGGPAGP
ncbi:EAL domain-containing protein [Ectothiorhodospira mobilis]|uniref:EAL domain-containing protein n=1 Tax=Ectothiorhodospira mobilis TaxID=195064 RepID=UPI0019085E0A|nr:EAL domain-containing protein [Ectothiorhodospira mobilis]MBK1691659.1 diguanylate phosphodiesterase [Ectothiorhodospira mobilis]